MDNIYEAMKELYRQELKKIQLERLISFGMHHYPQVGQTYEVYQNDFGCRSGIHYDSQISFETKRIEKYSGFVFHSEQTKCIGRLRITKLKNP